MADTDPLTLNLQTLRSTSIASLVRGKIEEQIISGERQGGDHLSEQELTRTFQVSRGPVREALRALEGQGLLEQKKNKGWFVKRLSKQEVEQVFEMRDILDKGMARLLVSKQAEPDFVTHLSELDDLVGKMDIAIERDDIRSYARLNQGFHDTLLSAAGNDHLTKTYRNLMCELASHVVKSLELNDAMRNSNDEHREIVEELKAGNEGQLCKIFASHRAHTRERMSTVSDD
ncbi:MAG: FCD domain-containing protein [Roseibium album]|uniref:FCD domain-containing protein n=1 Tax=Roseibium album TaxID=311410 RepID=UPI0032EDDC5D